MKNKNLVISIYGFNIESIKPDENNSKLIRGEKLFQNIDIKAYEGEIVLLLGASGTGKSLLTNILLGFIPLWERGIIITPNTSTSHFKVILDNKEIEILQPIYPQELEGKIGIMFQTLGLFDDLTVEENLAFANAQSSSPKKGNEWKAWRKEILNTLNLPSIILNSDVTKLSGGQKQRVAFGRILAFNPKIIIFDEPTSALDYNSTQQVVNLIKKTHKENKNLLTLIITHDYENFIKIADRVWFINSNQQIENHSPPKSSNYYKKEIAKERKPTNREISIEEYIEHEIKCKDIWWNTLIKRFFISLKKSILLKSYYWFLKFFWVMFKLLVIRSIPYNLITGFFLGLVATYFSLNLNLGSLSLSSGEQVKIENFIVPAFFQEMLSGFGIVMFRALIPLFTCIFIAARSGTAVTAYISNMKDKERRQWDAMKNLGIDPLFFFFPQVLICFMFGAWFLSYISFLVSALGSLLVALTTNYLCTWYTWVNTFWAHLHPKPLFGIFKFIPIFDGFGMFTLKTLCSGMAIAIISFAWGVKQRKSSMDTLKHLIGANICNISAILLIFFIILIYEMG